MKMRVFRGFALAVLYRSIDRGQTISYQSYKRATLNATHLILNEPSTNPVPHSSPSKSCKILNHSPSLPPHCLSDCLPVSLQCDLAQRVVSADSIDRFSKANGFVTWMETSVKENKNIGEAMR